MLDPGQTTYDARAFCVTHDITSLLRSGPNAVGVMVGNGLFIQNHAFNAPSLMFGEPTAIAKLAIDYADGTTQEIVTDDSWRAQTGPILYDSVYAGEAYDARLKHAGWDQPGYDDSSWQAAAKVKPTTKPLVSQTIPPNREMEALAPVKVLEGNVGKWIFDLGRNIAGWLRIKITAPAGTRLRLKCAEVLVPDGESLDHGMIRCVRHGRRADGNLRLQGGGVETWSPRFPHHGFRYVEVPGLPGDPPEDFLCGVLVHTDVPRAGVFEGSDAILNRICQVSPWTI